MTKFLVLDMKGQIVPIAVRSYGSTPQSVLFVNELTTAKAYALRLSDSTGDRYRVLQCELVGTASPLPKSQFVEASINA